MLKKFLLNALSSFVGAWLAIVLLIMSGFLLFASILGNFATKGNTEVVKSRSILCIDLNGEIIEAEKSTKPDYMSIMQGNLSRPQTLNVIVESIKEAARNKNIAGIYIKCGYLAASPATLNAIREEIIEFKKSGKAVYAYGNNFTTGSYFVASAADRIYLNPQGQIELMGMNSSVMYMKDLFDKLGIQFQVVKVGTFKSAVEPYIMEHMSEPARAQMDTLLGNMWKYITTNISDSRNKKGLTASFIDTLVSVDNISFSPAEAVMKSGLVDTLIYERCIRDRFARLTSQESNDVNFVSPATLVNQVPWSDSYDSKNQIVVLYATGEIADGNPQEIDYQTLVPVITRLAEDKNIKGMVLRVNSPGGSAYGSDQIGEALDYFQSKGKPLAVSMGDYAASGGYWISAGADIIFADPLTITGSIGIFGLIPNVSGLTEKLGLNMELISTNPDANFPTFFKGMSERQLTVMQKYVDRGYENFVSRVAKGRKMSVAAVKRIAEGRVWDAMTARKIGLVDSLGSLQKAIEWTAAKAKVSDKYDVAAYPQYEQTIWDILPAGSTVSETIEKIERPSTEEAMLEYGRRILNQYRIQARMPEIRVGFN